MTTPDHSDGPSSGPRPPSPEQPASDATPELPGQDGQASIDAPATPPNAAPTQGESIPSAGESDRGDVSDQTRALDLGARVAGAPAPSVATGAVAASGDTSTQGETPASNGAPADFIDDTMPSNRNSIVFGPLPLIPGQDPRVASPPAVQGQGPLVPSAPMAPVPASADPSGRGVDTRTGIPLSVAPGVGPASGGGVPGASPPPGYGMPPAPTTQLGVAGPGVAGPGVAGPSLPRPAAPEAEARQPRRPFDMVLAGVVAIVVALGGYFGITWALGLSEQAAVERANAVIAGPDHLAEEYLRALGQGNARGAWALATNSIAYAPEPGMSEEITFPAGGVLLTNAAYTKASAPLRDGKVTRVQTATDGKTATVDVQYRVGDETISETFDMARSGTTDGFAQWEFAKAPVGSIDYTAPDGMQIIIGGVDVTAQAGDDKQVTLPAMPAGYDIVIHDPAGQQADRTIRVIVGPTDTATKVDLAAK